MKWFPQAVHYPDPTKYGPKIPTYEDLVYQINAMFVFDENWGLIVSSDKIGSNPKKLLRSSNKWTPIFDLCVIFDQ